MKTFIKYFSVIAAVVLMSTSAFAQEIPTINMDSIVSYYIVTGDNTYEKLPLEMGEVKPHRNKVSKFTRLVKKAAGVVSAGALVGGVAGGAGSVSTAVDVMGAANTVSTVSTITNGLAGIEGKDIAFKGKKSSYKVKDKKGGIKIIVEINTTEQNPMEICRVVRFFEADKDRRVQWGEYKPALIGEKESFEHGFLGFTAEKCGENRFLINIPENQLKSGEYGILVKDIVTALALPVGTFSIK